MAVCYISLSERSLTTTAQDLFLILASVALSDFDTYTLSGTLQFNKRDRVHSTSRPLASSRANELGVRFRVWVGLRIPSPFCMRRETRLLVTAGQHHPVPVVAFIPHGCQMAIARLLDRAEMQENMWARLRDSRPGACLIYAI